MNLTYLPKDTSVQEALKHLAQYGALVIEDLADAQTIDLLKSEIAPYIDNTPMGQDKFSGHRPKGRGDWLADLAFAGLLSPTI